jgi:hypothetical protein
MEVPDDLTRVIRAHVHNFLLGFPATLMAGHTAAAAQRVGIDDAVLAPEADASRNGN